MRGFVRKPSPWVERGLIAAALLTPPRNFMLQRDGFNRIAYSGDYMPTYANGGIGVTERTAYTLRVRQLAVAIAKRYVESEDRSSLPAAPEGA
mgnify:CR=1 FL=1